MQNSMEMSSPQDENNSATSALVSHLLLSNAPPSDEEATQIRQLIIALEENIVLLDPEHDEASTKARVNLSNAISDHKAVLSSIRLLPPELVEKILLDAQDDCFPNRYFRYSWAISHVCRSWRDVVISNPRFWNTIVVDLNLKSRRARSFESCIDLVLERSRTAGLRLGIYGLPEYDDDPWLLSTLANHSGRWSHLFIESRPEILINLSSIKGRIPLLSRMGIHFLPPEGYPWTYEDYILDMFAVAPQLRYTLVAGSLGSSLTTVYVPFPWSQLKMYEDHIGNRANKESLFYALSPRLERLKIRLRHPISHTEILHFPHLQNLAVKFMLDNAHLEFFERLALPSLREASFKGRISDFIPRFAALVSRSTISTTCHLTVLRFNGFTSFQPGELTSLLQLTPQLQKLSLPLPPIDDLLGLAKTGGLDSIAPKLYALHISVEDLISEDHRDPIRQLAAARCGSMCQNSTDVNQHHASDTQRINSLTFTFTTEQMTRLGYSLLQEGFPEERLDEKVVKTMTAWKTQLWDSIPWLGNQSMPRASFLKESSLKKLDRLFSTIANYDVPSSAHLRASSLHFLLHIISNQAKDGDIPGDGCYHFRARATSILDKWKPLLLKDLPHCLWRISGRTLIYTPSHDEIRSKAEGMDLVYGGVNRSWMYSFERTAMTDSETRPRHYSLIRPPWR